MKYLYIYTTEFDNIPQAEIQGVFSVIGDCVTAVHNYEIRLKTDLTVEKLLYHILLKAINQVRELGRTDRKLHCESVAICNAER